MVIRWLGAFRGSESLQASFAWELSEPSREVAAERVTRRRPSRIPQALVGLRVQRNSVIRVYPGDVWSGPDADGRLQPTRRGVPTHTEAFCKPRYDAIVLKCPMARLRPEIREAVQAASETFNLPIIVIGKGGHM